MMGYDEEGNSVKKFFNVIRSIEDKIINAVVEQSEAIFGKQMSKEELVPMFNSNIKESPDREPKFRVKVDTTPDNEIKCMVCDPERNVLNDTVMNGLYSRNSGVSIVELVRVFLEQKVRMYVEIIQSNGL